MSNPQQIIRHRENGMAL